MEEPEHKGFSNTYFEAIEEDSFPFTFLTTLSWLHSNTGFCLLLLFSLSACSVSLFGSKATYVMFPETKSTNYVISHYYSYLIG